MTAPVKLFTCCFFLLFTCAATKLSAQSVWHFKTRSITVTEEGHSKIAVYKDSSKTAYTPAPAAARTAGSCPDNLDFELGSFANWECYTGIVTVAGGVNTVSNLVLSGPLSNRHTIISNTTTPALDQYGSFPVLCPNGSGKSVKLGNNLTGSQAERIRYTFTIPASQTDFNLIYNYAVVFQDPSHPQAQQPRFQAKIYDAATGAGLLACANYDFTAAANLPGFSYSPLTPNSPRVLYKTWTPVTINLSGFNGRTMILEFTTTDCTAGGHFGYAYVDVNTSCNGFVSGASYCQGVNSVTLTAPPGYQAYNWFNQDYTQALGTTQTITLSPPPPANTVVNIDLVPFPGFGCRDTVYTTVTVGSIPTAAFETDTTPVCQGANNFSFTNGSVVAGNSTLSYLWRFGDNSTATTATPSHSYAAPGVYTVKLVATTNIGCKDSTTKKVTVLPNPSATFNILTPVQQCITGNAFTFQNTSPPYAVPVTYSWTLGDGNNSTSQTSVNYSYTAGATYNVKLFAVQSGNNNCKDSMTRQVIVDPLTTASIALYNSGRQCFKNNLFRFKNTSTNAGSYDWNFGDGTFSSASEPVHAYTSPGTYTVKLLAHGLGACGDSAVETVIVDPDPVAIFQVTSNPSQCQDNNLFTFQNNSSIAGGTLDYSWTFGDGNTSTQQHGQHSFSNAGTFNITLVAASAQGCRDTARGQVFVDSRPFAAFTITGVDEQCLRSNNFNFRNTTTIPQGSVTTAWSFGDGGLSTITNPAHGYLSAGTYTVKLVTTSSKGCVDSISKTVTVHPNPKAAFSVSDSSMCFRGNSFSFANESSLATGVLSYSWNFGDATSATQLQPMKTFATFLPFYNVMLEASSDKGCKDTAYRKIYLLSHPVASFSIVQGNEQCDRNNFFTFANASSFTTGTLSYQWALGDGNTSAQTNPSAHYMAPGDYNVRLITKANANNCTDTVVRTVTIVKTPVSDFKVNDSAQCLAGNNFTFSSVAPVSAYRYRWTFGDGNTDNVINPSHNYAAATSYNVQLIVDNIAASGLTCSDTTRHIAKVNPMPSGNITNKGTYSLCEGNTKSLIASGAVSYQWYHDGNIVPGAVAATYNAPAGGMYTVSAINQFGCKTMLQDSVRINEIKKPQANFTWDSYCINRMVKFTANGNPGANNIVQYSWNLGNGQPADTSASPQFSYPLAGTYKILLVVTSALCPLHLSTIEKNIRIEEPLKGQRYTTVNAVKGSTYNLLARTGGVQFLWMPATDLSNATVRTPVLTATKEREYKIEVTTSSGCKVTDTLAVRIFDESQIFVPKAFTPNNDGLNDKLYPILVGAAQLRYFRVYNRWGNLVFSTSSAGAGWDGYYKGTLQPSETFTWVAEAIDEKGKVIHNGGNTILIR